MSTIAEQEYHLNKISTQSFETALANKRLVYGAVKAAGVLPHNIEYEDFIQEGLISYAVMIEQNKKNKLSKKEHELDCFAFRKIIWQTIDALRRQKFLTGIAEYSLDENLFEQEAMQVIGGDQQLIVTAELTEVAEQLDKLEQVLLTEFFLKGQKLKDIATANQVSLQTVTRAKKRVRNYLQQYITY